VIKSTIPYYNLQYCTAKYRVHLYYSKVLYSTVSKPQYISVLYRTVMYGIVVYCTRNSIVYTIYYAIIVIYY